MNLYPSKILRKIKCKKFFNCKQEKKNEEDVLLEGIILAAMEEDVLSIE